MSHDGPRAAGIRSRVTLDNNQLLLIELLVCLAAWAGVYVVFVAPRLRRIDPQRALRLVIAPQMFRIIGLTLLADGVAGPGLDPTFAAWVANGDAVTAGLAIAAFVALRRPGALGLGLAAATTLVGGLDLVHNLTTGIRIDAAQHLGAGWFVVAVIVPLMAVAHVAAARLLLARPG